MKLNAGNDDLFGLIETIKELRTLKELEMLKKQASPSNEVETPETKEGSSLNLQPSAVIGRSMVHTKPDKLNSYDSELEEKIKELRKHCYYVVSRDSFLGKVTAIASNEDFEETTIDDLIRLMPITQKFVLDIETAIQLTQRQKEGNPVSDERIEKVKNAIEDIEQNTTFTRLVVHKMLLEDEDKFGFHNKWLHYYDKNITSEMAMPRTMAILNKMIFGVEPLIKNEAEDEKVELFQKLVENKEVFAAIRNQEIDIVSGINLGLKYRKETPLREKVIALYSQFSDKLLTEKILETTKFHYSNYSFLNSTYEGLSQINNSLLEILAVHSKDEIIECLNKVEKLKQKAVKNAELYVNGNFSNLAVEVLRVIDFFRDNSIPLVRLAFTFDDDVIDVLMRKRFKEFQETLNHFNNLSYKDTQLLTAMTKCSNIDGKPFSQNQKAEFIELVSGYKNNNIDTENIKKMTEEGRIDVEQLKLNLFRKILENAGLNEEEIALVPKEKLMAWDTKYAHFLAKGISSAAFYEEQKRVYKDIIIAANLYDFDEYIHDQSNKYGKANANTRQMYEDLNLDYEKWIHPSKDLETDFVSVDSTHEKLKQISDLIEEDMNLMLLTPVKNHIKKQFPNFIKDEKFVVPSFCYENKMKLLELAQSLADTSENGKMFAVWKRAKSNVEGKKRDSALSTLTFLDHFQERVEDVKKLENNLVDKNLNLKIKMWDRFPQKDLFQGNYSSCCIAIGRTNGNAMPHYLMNTAYNMIEIKDNESGKTIGNALCYFVKTDENKPVFVIDNIEININDKPSNQTGRKLRNAIAEYASKVAKQITGREGTLICMSNRYNDVPTDDLTNEDKTVSFLGDIDCDRIYMDLFGTPAGWTSKKNFTQTCNLYKLKG